MAVPIPEQYRDLFSEEKKAFGYVATVMPDGTPQVTPVWVDYDGTHVIFNTAKGRVKERNLRRDGRVALVVSDPGNPYRYIQVRGRAELSEEGADAHIDKLAKKYLGMDRYPYRQPGEVRVMVRITPEAVQTWG
ncbi:MAG: PPOX class F420-dependent oxidoreductase [Anaerolineae bacterium]|nr:PPOX class F420-dependent oxidoreductase [Anaerolineae bacterium]MDW8071255.1 PPOX class F420-dependent oxidoreductase [Anaerolineae bacterium]